MWTHGLAVPAPMSVTALGWEAVRDARRTSSRALLTSTRAFFQQPSVFEEPCFISIRSHINSAQRSWSTKLLVHVLFIPNQPNLTPVSHHYERFYDINPQQDVGRSVHLRGTESSEWEGVNSGPRDSQRTCSAK